MTLVAAVAASAQTDWPFYGHDPGGMRHSPLKQITTANVSKLKRAWTLHTGPGPTGSESTPLVIKGVMYLTSRSAIFAVEPETGKVIWRYDGARVTDRGVTYWPGDRQRNPRVYVGVGSNLVALDVTTGKPAPGFGKEGIVDMRQGVADGLGDVPFSMLSPPVIYKDIVITGSNNSEGTPSIGAYGDVRGWDASTGKLLWTFHTVPRPGEPGNETWKGDSWKNRSGTNVWGFMTVDVERGLVFLPIGAPTSDFYGADRHGDNLYGNSLVALDAATGKLKWYQQLVHHDIWDYDPAAPPAILELTRGGRKTRAVAQITKTGLLFVFDEMTGAPIYGMEERPVPQSRVPGEATSRTQPFPLKPPPLSRMTFEKEDLYNLTPEHAAFCKDLWEREQMYTEGPYTPFQLERTAVTFPSTLGGGGWGGVSFDPSLGYIITNVMNLGQWGHMEKREDPKTGAVTYVRNASVGGAYARFWDPKTFIACQNPPFGELVAVNAATGDIAWKVPLGITESLEAKGIKNAGAPNIAGSITTAGGLIFIGATNDSRFRAFETRTGKELWIEKMETSAYAVPITYLGKDGKQYVVVMAGGGNRFGSPPGDSLIAFTLP